jgi:hypothetical protein
VDDATPPTLRVTRTVHAHPPGARTAHRSANLAPWRSVPRTGRAAAARSGDYALVVQLRVAQPGSRVSLFATTNRRRCLADRRRHCDPAPGMWTSCRRSSGQIWARLARVWSSVAVAFIVIGAALVAGLLANRRVRPFAKTEVQGVKLELLISPLLTLTVLLLAFVLVQVFSGYRASKDAAGLEAGRVLFEYDLADYYDDEFAQPMQESLLCYARAIANQEWRSLDDDPFPNPVATRWGRGMDAPLAELRTVDADQPYGTLLTADKERADGRRLRIVQARPALPREMELLLLGTSAVAVLGIATFTLANVSRRTQIGALSVLAVILALVLVTIDDLDRKYDGLIQIENEDFLIADELLSPRYAERYPDQPLPCDERGLPI